MDYRCGGAGTEGEASWTIWQIDKAFHKMADKAEELHWPIASIRYFEYDEEKV